MQGPTTPRFIAARVQMRCQDRGGYSRAIIMIKHPNKRCCSPVACCKTIKERTNHHTAIWLFYSIWTQNVSKLSNIISHVEQEINWVPQRDAWGWTPSLALSFSFSTRCDILANLSFYWTANDCEKLTWWELNIHLPIWWFRHVQLYAMLILHWMYVMPRMPRVIKPLQLLDC